MEELNSFLGLHHNDFILLSGLLIIFIITLLVSLLTRDKSEVSEVQTETVEPIQQESVELQKPPVQTEIKSSKQIETERITVEGKAIIPESIVTDTTDSSRLPEAEIKPEGHHDTPETIEEVSQPIWEKPAADIEGVTQIPELPVKEENIFTRLRSGLSKTHNSLIGKLDQILKGNEISGEIWDEFEETLIMSDLGVTTTLKLRQEIEKIIDNESATEPSEIKNLLKVSILEILKKAQGKVDTSHNKPLVMMVAGVNGVGKTTTIGKLAYKFKEEGKSVMVAAADTFRAAAVDQLEIWSKRVGSEFIRGQMGSDPAAVAFDAVKAAIARKMDVLIIDTAGRLHTRTNLMEELKKLRKIIGRELEGAPHETILVLDATTGQNAVQQAKLFDEALELTGIALTKLDGTAKGGVIVSIANELNIPVKYIGIGESLKDLRDFNAEEFVEALFFSESETIH